MIEKITNEALAAGQIVREPVGDEKGYWVGCPGAYHDAEENAWYLTYRIRRPRGVQPDRGGEVRVCRSTDLKQWDDVLTIRKDQYNTASIERSVIRRGPDGQWRYFSSYVDAEDGRWCTNLITAPTVGELDPAKQKVIFKAAPLGLEGVKDPWVTEIDGVYHMFLSIALPTGKTGDDAHSSLDIYNTGQCVSATGLATSTDLDNWDYHGTIFAPEGDGWDKYCRRINSVVRKDGKYYAFFDGSASHLENYEEKTAIAVSDDLKSWTNLNPDGPALVSPFSSTSIRYIDAQPLDGKWHVFYEFAREDGAHNMRLVVTDEAGLPF
ncbi:MAG: hypothetical protein ACJASX_000961 [Limisphaerales bacterium]|jgi:hypothetical protein